MRKERVFLILGLWISVLSYLGFPYYLKNILFTISGLILVYYSYLLRQEYRNKHKEEKIYDNFSENFDFPENSEHERQS